MQCNQSIIYSNIAYLNLNLGLGVDLVENRHLLCWRLFDSLPSKRTHLQVNHVLLLRLLLLQWGVV